MPFRLCETGRKRGRGEARVNGDGAGQAEIGLSAPLPQVMKKAPPLRLGGACNDDPGDVGVAALILVRLADNSSSTALSRLPSRQWRPSISNVRRLIRQMHGIGALRFECLAGLRPQQSVSAAST